MTHTKKIITVDPKNPEKEAIERAVEVIEGGGVIAFPTWCLYGLGADALNPDAVNSIFKIKRRPETKALLVLLHNTDQISQFASEISADAKKLISRFWPGRVTLLFKAHDTLPENLTAGTGKIGIRVPENRVAFKIAEKLGRPFTGTSANISDQPGCSSIEDMDQRIIDGVDLVLDAGRLHGKKGSAIVDVSVSPPVILREGEVSSEEIYAALKD